MATNHTADDDAQTTDNLTMPDGQAIAYALENNEICREHLLTLLETAVEENDSPADWQHPSRRALVDAFAADGQLSIAEAAPPVDDDAPARFDDEQDAIDYQNELKRWRLDCALLESVTGPRMNVERVSPHNVPRQGTVSYRVEVIGDYLHDTLADTFEQYGFRVKSVDFETGNVRVQRERPAADGEYKMIPMSHHLVVSEDDLVDTVLGPAGD
jgi:hypothetical protein